ncbi:sugar ABC transporter permease [Bifidobacterium subtile]|jgi:sn-glycerol 3-phosphate transport system permease protein|nr:sugar ABC transporter permease [Bifidobacterium subtile]
MLPAVIGIARGKENGVEREITRQGRRIGRRKGQGISHARARTGFTACALLLPSFALLAVFTIFPIGQTLRQSLYLDDPGLPAPQFVGAANYQALASDQVFWKALGNSAIYVVGIVPCSVALAMVMAMMINRVFKGNSAVRSLFFYPVILPLVAVANIWLYLYSSEGIITWLLSVLHMGNESLLSSGATVKVALIVMLVWKDASFYMVFFLAALKNLPQDVFEAAALDGAHGWKLFWNMTFPLVMPTTLFCLVMSTADAFHLIDHLIVMTQGGPNNASTSLLYYIYQASFQFVDASKATTVTACLLLVLLIVFGAQLSLMEKK